MHIRSESRSRSGQKPRRNFGLPSNASTVGDTTVTSRRNKSSTAIITHDQLAKPFSEGSFRKAAKGEYVDGPRKGQICVVKWFKPEVRVESSNKYFQEDMKAVDKSIEIIRKFNSLRLAEYTITMCLGEVWKVGSSSTWSGRRLLVEPYIHGYRKFNSNSIFVQTPHSIQLPVFSCFRYFIHELDPDTTQGYSSQKDEPGKLMQALSHYSYHDSKGRYLLCDLQGGVDAAKIALTDPVILSLNRSYGVTDLGSRGIVNFFRKHTCNKFCSSWDKPKMTGEVKHIPSKPGTTMTA